VTPAKTALEVFHEQFEGESDRACVILGAAALDEELRTLLRAFFVPSPTESDSLLDGANAPLGSFSSRIDAAHRLGLISARFARDLHVIRRIRNAFAHDISNCRFDNQAVGDRVAELARSSGMVERLGSPRALGNPRGVFAVTVSWMLFVLHHKPDTLQPLEAAAEEWGYDRSLTKDRLLGGEEQLRRGNRAFFPEMSDQEFNDLRARLLERDAADQPTEPPSCG
jgi:hypothetical protein